MAAETQFVSFTTHSPLEDTALRPSRELPLQSLDPAALLDTLTIQLRGREAYDQLLTAAHPEIDMIDFSPEAIRANALALAAETLPADIVEALQIPYEIKDQVAYSQPPTLETTLMIGSAWDMLREKPTPVARLLQSMEVVRPTAYDPLESAFAASIDALGEREERSDQFDDPTSKEQADVEDRNLIGFAYQYATATGTSLRESYAVALSRRSGVSDHDLLLAQEKLEIRQQEAKIRETAEREKEAQLHTHSAAEIAMLREKDVAKKVDMSQFFND